MTPVVRNDSVVPRWQGELIAITLRIPRHHARRGDDVPMVKRSYDRLSRRGDRERTVVIETANGTRCRWSARRHGKTHWPM
jgi:hypothetical protein